MSNATLTSIPEQQSPLALTPPKARNMSRVGGLVKENWLYWAAPSDQKAVAVRSVNVYKQGGGATTKR